MNNQTIDGVLVSREQLVRWEELLRTPPGRQELLDELRALLDAPAAPVTPCAIADALEASQWPNTSIGNKVLVAAAITELRKAAQPQGEPVATIDRARKIEQLRGAFEQRFKLDIWPVIDWLRNSGLYAEQPAPVAVVLPERLNHAEGLHTYEYVTGHNAAIDKMLGKSEKEQDHGKP